jgi:hypothetical protein
MPLQPFSFENKPHSHAFYVFEFSEHSQHAFFNNHFRTQIRHMGLL